MSSTSSITTTQLQDSHFIAIVYRLNESSRFATSVVDFSEINQSALVRSLMWLDKHLFPWDRLPACPLLLKPDRLEAYPTCLSSVAHAQEDRTRRERGIDDCRVMMVDF